MDFVPFPKMARLSREIVITEKIDGTNAQINIEKVDACFDVPADPTILMVNFAADANYLLRAGSRSRWVTLENDHYGFAAWARTNGEELMRLGPGAHFGEWWGKGVQRNYGLDERRFSLFNVARWGGEWGCPACCSVVPTLYRGIFSSSAIDAVLLDLKVNGSRAAPGFAKPEGIVIFHSASGTLFKKTIYKDELPKALAVPEHERAAA